MTDLGLFDLPPGAVVPPIEPEHVSADRRRTMLQLERLRRRIHPLGGKLHDDAPPADDKHAPGPRCGNCAHRIATYRGFPKCGIEPITHGAGTDCRAWWPACWRYEGVDHA